MITYSAPYSRMRALKGNLLTKQQMESLIQTPDLQSAISILNQSTYSEQIQSLTTQSLIEHGLKQNLILSYIKILKFMRGKSARFVEDSLGRFDLYNAKTIIRSLIKGVDISGDSYPRIYSLGKYHKIRIQEAIEARSLAGFIDVMKNSLFASSLEIGYSQYESESNLMSLEIALDLGYYTKLQESFESLGPYDKSKAKKLVGMHYDMINITWMLRFRESYNLTPEQIFQYILPYGWKFKPPVFWKIIGSKDIIEALKERYMHPYDQVLASAEPINGNPILGAEIALMKFFYQESIKSLRGYPLQISPIFAFFVMKEMEIRDIITILGSKSLSLSQDRIRQHLITIN